MAPNDSSVSWLILSTGLLRHICLDSQGLTTSLSDFPRHGLRRVAVQISDCHTGPLSGQSQGNSSAYPSTTAGDNGPLSSMFHFFAPLSMWGNAFPTTTTAVTTDIPLGWVCLWCQYSLGGGGGDT